MLSEQDLAELRRQRRWSSALAYPVYFFVLAVTRFWYGYTFEELEEFQREVWRQLDAHDGPVIWAANHLTLIDSFLIFRAVTPLGRARELRRIPWSTPEYRNYYKLGGPIRQRLIRFLMYACRCIPFLREGEDEAAVRWRERAFEKLIWILREGGAVFVYPEAGRARNGWFERHRPKDFLGRLALEVPNAKFLCVYLRGDRQLYTTVAPDKGERFRMRAALVPAVEAGEASPRQISQRLFDTLAGLQDQWWKSSPLPRNCGGNDVVDLNAPLLRENIDPATGEADEEWLARHLTPKEQEYWRAQPAEKRFAVFWRFFAAKEAAHKALAQAGIATPQSGFLILEADLFRRKVVHRPTGCQADIAFVEDDADKLHCVAVLRGGWIGDEDNPGDVLARVEALPAGGDPHEEARELCLRFIRDSSDDIGPGALAFSDAGGRPQVLRAGKPMDWGVSISHSGRFVACSFMIS